ncbi:MAG: GAF domain-containing protein [Vicinamibacterales bacterium]
MPAAPIPLDEEARVRVLRDYHILDTEPEQAFEDIVRLASAICQTPIALIDASRQWFKARVGLEVQSTPREVAFCAHAIHDSSPLVVRDALTDRRFSDNPLVLGDPHIRFYAGSPLVTPDGHKLGTLCVIDQAPRRLEPDQRDALETLSRIVMQQLEMRRVTRELASALERARVLSGLLPICAYCKRVRDDKNYWSEVEQYVHTHAAVDFSHGICPDCVTRYFSELDQEEPGGKA